MHIGIDEKSRLAYEGINLPELPVVPSPIITMAKLIEAEEDWQNLPGDLAYAPTSWVFREETFDAVTRTRRGRLYQPASLPWPSSHRVVPHPYEDPFGRTIGAGGLTSKNLYVYMPCTTLTSKARRGEGFTLALGSPRATSAWRLIQTEELANKCVMVTLKSLSAFAILPQIDTAKVPEEFKTSIADALDSVLSSAFRETPSSVIDRCRDALTKLLSRWLVSKGCDRSILSEDLGKVATTVAKPPHNMICASNLAHVVARLHSRGKGNEQHAKSLRDPVEEDAALALHALGLTLRDIGWAA